MSCSFAGSGSTFLHLDWPLSLPSDTESDVVRNLEVANVQYKAKSFETSRSSCILCLQILVSSDPRRGVVATLRERDVPPGAASLWHVRASELWQFYGQWTSSADTSTPPPATLQWALYTASLQQQRQWRENYYLQGWWIAFNNPPSPEAGRNLQTS